MPVEALPGSAHTRGMTITLKQGEGRSIQFRADILDLRKGGLMGLGGRVATAGIIHKMELLGAFSSIDGTLEEIDWEQSHVMQEPTRVTKGECCRDPMPGLKALKGARLGHDFAPSLKQHFAGPLGCTHVNTLFKELDAFVSVYFDSRDAHPELQGSLTRGERIGARSVFFDACFPQDDRTSTLGVNLTDALYSPLDEHGNESLFSHDEVRLSGSVELASWQLVELAGSERSRLGPSYEPEPWQRRNDDLAGFAGRSLGGGLARHCFEQFGEQPDNRRLLSALLCLSPAMTQVGAALSDSLVPSSSMRPSGSGFALPSVCYMLRTEGPLMASIMGSDESEAD